AAGGEVHWARDADEANSIAMAIALRHGATEVVKVKSLTTDEIGLNDALAAAGVDAIETDFAELILQLDGDWSSHILVPAIHRNRTEIRDLFRRTIVDGPLSDEPAELAGAEHPPHRPGARRRGSPRRRAATCASGSCVRASASAAPTSASPRPGRSASSSRRGTAACARRSPRCS